MLTAHHLESSRSQRILRPLEALAVPYRRALDQGGSMWIQA